MSEADLFARPDTPMRRDDCRNWQTGFNFGATNSLSARLRAELASVSKIKKTANKESGEVDFDKLTDIGARRNLDVCYFQLRNARRLNSAVQIFVDISSSMEGKKMETAGALAHLLAKNLELLRVPVQVFSFNSDVYLVKDWNDKTDAQRLPLLSARGSTRLPPAMYAGAKILAQRKEVRKLQLVITDGAVGFAPSAQLAADCRAHTEYLSTIGASPAEIKAAVKSFEANGIGRLHKICPGLETLAFGIGSDVPAGIFMQAVSRLTNANLVDVVSASLGKALTAPLAGG